ncbi:hypothetical protein CsSME_00032855 [Camellia sinensis var. sinensis]
MLTSILASDSTKFMSFPWTSVTTSLEQLLITISNTYGRCRTPFYPNWKNSFPVPLQW